MIVAGRLGKPEHEEKHEMRHNGKPILKVSRLPINAVALYPGEHPTFACQEPGCGIWRSLKRRMLIPHPAPSGQGRCAGSWQRIEIDMTPEEWVAMRQEQLVEAVQDAAARRPTRVNRKPKVTPPPAVSQMRPRPVTSPEQQRLRNAREALAEHRKTCSTCKSGEFCHAHTQERHAADRAQQVYIETTSGRAA